MLKPIRSGASLLALPEDMRCKATVKQPKPLCTLTTGGKGKSRADEDVDATAAAEVIRLYCEKRRKVDCCESCIFNKGNKGPLCPLYGSPMGWDGFGGKENG